MVIYMKASLIIPTYNKLPRLRLTLASISLQKLDHQYFEIIIVDDGSNDGTEKFCQSGILPINGKYIRQNHLGRAAARNRGIKEAKNDILVFIDDDLLLSPSFLEAHLHQQEKEKAIIHGKIMDLPFLRFFEDPINKIFYQEFQKRPNSSYASLMDKCFSEIDVKDHFESLIRQARQYKMDIIAESLLNSFSAEVAWMAFSGGNISAPKEWIELQHGFDEAFSTTWGCEDLELGYRLCKQGYQFKYESNASNYHLSHYRSTYIQEHSKSVQYFFDKHKDDRIFAFHKLIIDQLSMDEFFAQMKSVEK